jgi:cytochrome c553
MFTLPRTHTLAKVALVALVALLVWPASHAADTSAADQLARWTAEAGAPAQAERGRVFFSARHGGEWSCASCHGTPPTNAGKHASTGKTIAPLAPAFNPKAFTDSARVDKWFRRNCKDVLSRECSAQEKADVMAYLIRLQP